MNAAPGSLNVLAVVRVGRHLVGIPGDGVVQALPRPDPWLSVPRRRGTVEGVFEHHGQLVPVVRIGSWLEGASLDDRVQEAPSSPHVLVLREATIGGRIIGLSVDAVMGVRRVAGGDVRRVFHDDDPEELFQHVVGAQGGQPALSVLDPARLARLSHVWCEQAEIAGSPEVGSAARDRSAGQRADTQSWASFGIGDARVGVRAADIAELISVPEIERLTSSRNRSRGICRWRGRVLPVLDLTQDVHAAAAPTPARWMCVLRRAGQHLGVLVDEVHGLELVESATFDGGRPGPTASLQRATCLSRQGSALHLIDTDALFDRTPEAEISAPRPAGTTGPGQAAASAASALVASSRASAMAFMIFEAGAALASPVDAIQEVIAMPPDVLPRLDQGRPVTIDWRGAAVPVWDLRRQPGVRFTTAPRQLAIVRSGGRISAVAIGGVRAMLAGVKVSRSTTASGSVDMITTGLGAARASYAVLDLAGFAGLQAA